MNDIEEMVYENFLDAFNFYISIIEMTHNYQDDYDHREDFGCQNPVRNDVFRKTAKDGLKNVYNNFLMMSSKNLSLDDLPSELHEKIIRISC